MYRNTYVEVDLNKIENNIKNIIGNYNEYKYYFATLKANAYGHDSYIVNTLIDNGINYIAVSTLEEALAIRKWNINIPILCLMPVPLEYINVCTDENITITIHDYDYFDDLMHTKVNGKIKVHLLIDSNTNKIGIKDKYEVKDIFTSIEENKKIILEGIYTELLSTIDKESYEEQISIFESIVKLIDINSIPIVHIETVGDLLIHEKIEYTNALRIDKEIYGIEDIKTATIKDNIKGYYNKIFNKPNPIVEDISYPFNLSLAFTLYSQVIQTKEVEKGEILGSNMDYKFNKFSKIAVISIGTSDGLAEELNKSYIAINDNLYQIIGNIDIDKLVVLIDDHVKLYDKVTVLGGGLSSTKIEQITKIKYEKLISSINKNVPRVFISNDKIKKIIEY